MFYVSLIDSILWMLCDLICTGIVVLIFTIKCSQC